MTDTAELDDHHPQPPFRTTEPDDGLKPSSGAASTGPVAAGPAMAVPSQARGTERYRRPLLALIGALVVAAAVLAYRARPTPESVAARSSVLPSTTASSGTRAADETTGSEATGPSNEATGPSSEAAGPGSGSDQDDDTSTVFSVLGTTTIRLAPSTTATTRSETTATTPSATTATTASTSGPTTAPTPEPTASTGSTVSTTAQPTTTVTVTSPPTTQLGDNIVVNGGFERPALSGGFAQLPIPGWTSTDGGRVEIWASGHDGVSASGGRQLAELNGTGPSTYAQTVAVRRGTSYAWSVDHRGRLGTDTLEVLVDGRVVATLTTGTAWQTYGGTVEAGSATMTLSLRSVTGGSAANLIDRVQLRPIRR